MIFHTHTHRPEPGYRVARCTRCRLGWTWKHADPIACPNAEVRL